VDQWWWINGRNSNDGNGKSPNNGLFHWYEVQYFDVKIKLTNGDVSELNVEAHL
jgi:hypothetical protein